MKERSTFRATRFLVLFALALASLTPSFAQDQTPPTVISVVPALAISIDAGLNPKATFSEAMNPATISSSTFELRQTSDGKLVDATVTYNAATNTATLDPTKLLSVRSYTAKVKGGS